ncbi:Re/Si-specific NAD(P)(+) transhydrogenase subunit alpha [Luteipulveratus halotolerans]|uniref:NAD(P) transhydrogenase subunit alpha n=1 Tax=Luteipulveratus halotolerans TaxID=1631356 RepID=A0A0L6CKS7_9MICO|nr:Re/Si-specific NAD(P)(+) transhydrogenase subunit alpha [Luteipulveratus halotolerans]KNX38362.1 NAD(P) transhydrogenase subunit alpha [Luteipulveratus halotolerans]
MRIGVPKEYKAGETRVAATPKTVGQLIDLGYDVLVEAGAGARSAYPDSAYADAGAQVVGTVEAWDCDIVAKINAPSDAEVGVLRSGTTVVSLMAPALSPVLLQQLAGRGVTALAMDAVPRISRAQSLDVLSSMANLGGYRAVVEAAHQFGSLFTGQVTAAGKVPPAKVFVIGAGVAGLAAIGTASSLGAVVRAFDVRPEVAEQVESMGAEFVRLDVPSDDEAPSADGYAKEMSGDLEALAMQMYARECAEADIVISTALIPGKPAPRLITADTVAAMRPGSVIVDMAAANGGNCELSEADDIVTSDNGVRIVGYTDLPGRLPTQASQLYGTNVVNLMKLLTPQKNGRIELDLDDQVVRGLTVAHGGEVTWPPPPVQVSAAASASGSEAARTTGGASAVAAPAPPPDPRRKYVLMALGATLFALAAAFSPASFLGHFTVFALAVIVGFYVISNVAHALHTPLMAETNAISGIILVGALLQVGSDNLLVRVLALAATVVASINIFGGFAVTGRMLKMFVRESDTAGSGEAR